MYKRLIVLTIMTLAILSHICFAETVTFNSSLKAKAGDQIALSAILEKPDGDGPFPAVILLHGCDGHNLNIVRWAAKLTYWGYVTLQVDSFQPRGVSAICGSYGDARSYSQIRVRDAYDANSFLSTLPYVDSKKITLMGWSHGGWTTLNAFEAGAKELFIKNPFKAAVAFYPYCCEATQSNFGPPTLILIGESDDWTPADCCVGLNNSAKKVFLKIYPNSYHLFDNEDVLELTYMGHKLGYNPEATEDSILQVKNILTKYLR
jgi:dienelactone hydrolase